MPQLTDDCFAHGGELMRTDAALAEIAERTSRVTEAENVPLRHALGRVLLEDVVARHDVPPHDNSAVDGYAVYFDDLNAEGETRLPVGARVTAGHPLDRPQRRGEAVRIFTGSRMPDGPETVLMQEDGREADGYVTIPQGVRRGDNRRKAGEDIQAGDTVLRAGRRLRPQDLGQAAAVGRPALTVSRPLRVAVFSTGDELREPGEPLDHGCIHDSNRFTITGLLRAQGCEVIDMGILRDTHDAVVTALADAAERADLIVTSGGISVGEEDHVRQAVEARGQLHMWKLAIKPGRPIALGQIGRVPFAGFPGNPVAVMVTFINVVRPLILGLMGGAPERPATYRVPAGFSHKKKPARREWVRARLVGDPARGWRAEKFERQGSGILSSLVESDGLVELAEDTTSVAEGDPIDFMPFSEVTP